MYRSEMSLEALREVRIIAFPAIWVRKGMFFFDSRRCLELAFSLEFASSVVP